MIWKTEKQRIINGNGKRIEYTCLAKIISICHSPSYLIRRKNHLQSKQVVLLSRYVCLLAFFYSLHIKIKLQLTQQFKKKITKNILIYIKGTVFYKIKDLLNQNVFMTVVMDIFWFKSITDFEKNRTLPALFVNRWRSSSVKLPTITISMKTFLNILSNLTSPFVHFSVRDLQSLIRL